MSMLDGKTFGPKNGSAGWGVKGSKLQGHAFC